ncbi:MAG: PHP domain-containing protein [Saprospiraceae bacterium]|nr:PHP domain-containing protein [Saprospiraceae bacterium]
MKAIIHLHSKYSFDCLTPPEKLVDLAIKNAIDVLCITDHDTIEGAVHALQYAQNKYGDKLKVIIGAEYKTDYGDIIGLNLTKDIHLTRAEDVLNAIRAQGGLVLLPHPFESHKKVDFLAEQADAIEIFNARASFDANKKAAELVTSLGKPSYVASDAHFLSDALLCINQFDMSKNASFTTALLTAKRSFCQQQSSRKHYFQSQMIGAFRKRNLRRLLSATKNWLLLPPQ